MSAIAASRPASSLVWKLRCSASSRLCGTAATRTPGFVHRRAGRRSRGGRDRPASVVPNVSGAASRSSSSRRWSSASPERARRRSSRAVSSGSPTATSNSPCGPTTVTWRSAAGSGIAPIGEPEVAARVRAVRPRASARSPAGSRPAARVAGEDRARASRPGPRPRPARPRRPRSRRGAPTRALRRPSCGRCAARSPRAPTRPPRGGAARAARSRRRAGIGNCRSWPP